MGESGHYKTLGLRRDASKAQVKAAFSRLALLHHPDRHARADAATRADATRRFRLAYDAYHVLYDDSRRAEYDLRTAPPPPRLGVASGSAAASPAPPRPRVAIGLHVWNPRLGKQEKADSSLCVFVPIAAAAAMGGLYRALGLARNASKTDIKNAYFRLAQRYHPDHQPQADATACAEAARRFREAKDAYDVLSDDCCRAEYDRQLRRSSSSSSSSYRQGGSSASSSSSSSNHENRHGGGTSGSSYSSSSSGYRHSGSSSSSSSKNYLVLAVMYF
ncbi:hypothetical protein ACQ4PT_050563 [Festuca glaucescens]